jgi:hypothetical protein
MSSSFFWRVNGLALVHSSVDLLRSPLPKAGLGDLVGEVGSCSAPLGSFRSLEDRECARPLLSRSASALVGDLSVLGSASSSIVFPRDRKGLEVSVRLRMVMPWRCLSLRFCPSQLQASSPLHLSKHTYGSSHGRSLRGGGSDCAGACDDVAMLRSLPCCSGAVSTRLQFGCAASHGRIFWIFCSRFSRQAPTRHDRYGDPSRVNRRGAVVLEHAEELALPRES